MPHRLKQKAALVSIVSNSTLVAGKLTVGLCIGSVSVISEAVHSAVDLLASVIAYVAVRMSHLPPDEQHPYGHGKSENISGLLEGVLIFLAAAWIIVEAAKKLLHGTELENPGWGVTIMLVSTVVNWLVSRYLFKVGRQTDSMALTADAWHLRTDVWTSLGVMIGLGIIQAGHWFCDWHLYWLDPVAAIAVALLIIHAGWELSSKACHELMDSHLPKEDVEWLRAYISRPRGGLFNIHKFRTRKAGGLCFIEFHLVVDRAMSVQASHQITDDMTADIRARYPDAQVLIHVEPGRENQAAVAGPIPISG